MCLGRFHLYRVRIGFTLIELLLVLTLLGLMAGSIVVMLQGRDEPYALHAATEDLATAVRYAANQSRSSQRPCRVAFSEDGGAFWIESSPAGAASDIFKPVDGMAGTTHTLPEGVSVLWREGGGPEPLVFGTGSDLSNSEIVLVSSDESMRRIIILPDTIQVITVGPE